ncbi:MAG: hypothetical protein ACRDD7_04705 [Peptostreptococcaceae bacterium]
MSEIIKAYTRFIEKTGARLGAFSSFAIIERGWHNPTIIYTLYISDSVWNTQTVFSDGHVVHELETRNDFMTTYKVTITNPTWVIVDDVSTGRDFRPSTRHLIYGRLKMKNS